ncbi:hypothetical protein F2Q70_00015663 [Brassica cretica]|uniref:Uncharacterized protein n=1 Tax=Brassica cretica TaxID=69181 RepID=A0A8S9HR67_BRACR|nr:hypothetical protein F2Q70_00015663 [Brassica cretica]
MFLSASPVRQTGVPTSVTQPSNFVIHRFTPVGRANHYMSSLKAGSIVKVDRFELLLRSISSQNKTVRQSPSDCEHKPKTPRCGWANPFCPGL